MFSANENIQLRQYKKKVIQYVEETISDDILDLGVNVMAMQVTCNMPGCVPIETAIVIVFPENDGKELIPGLPESNGGSYKTKILKPMSSITKDDVLQSLPPPLGNRTIEKLCIRVRDIMFGQITQTFSDEDVEGRKLMAKYLQSTLQDYMNHNCIPPEWGEEYEESSNNNNNNEKEGNDRDNSKTTTGNIIIQRPTDNDDNNHDKGNNETKKSNNMDQVLHRPNNVEYHDDKKTSFAANGNVVIQRPADDIVNFNYSNHNATAKTSSNNDSSSTKNQVLHVPDDTIMIASESARKITTNNNNSHGYYNSTNQVVHNVPDDTRQTITKISVHTQTRQRKQTTIAIQKLQNINSTSSSILTQLSTREHAPGIRRPGCPCCDPDHPSNVVDQFMQI